MRYLTIIFFHLVLLSCNSEIVNKEIQPSGIFTADETAEISKMLTQFRATICQSKIPNAKCCEEYFKNYWESLQKGYINTNIDSIELMKILSPIAKGLESKLFYETKSKFDNRIPNTSPPLNIRDSIEYFSVNYYKSFLPIFQELTVKHSHLKKASQWIQETGDLTPSILVKIYSNWDKYNYLDNTEMLFLSLIIMSQTDEQIKQIKSYSKAIRPIEDKLKERAKKRITSTK